MFFCPCAGLMHLEVQNPMHSLICVLMLFAEFLHTYGILWLPMQLFERSGAFFMQRVYNLKNKMTFFKTDSVFRILFFFPFEMSIYFKSYVFRL